jgi:menaquinone-dependent protoporphyrinogen IX oxidase
MSKIVVIYKSTYGTVKSYAEWIAKELKADLLDQSEAKQSTMQRYDTIIYGGGIYAGSIAGVDLISKNYAKLFGKLLVVFSVGFTPQTRRDILIKILSKSFDNIQQQGIQFYHFPGRVDYKQLHMLHRIALAGKKFTISGKDEQELTEENVKFLQSYGKSPETLSLDLTLPLIEFVRERDV